MFIDEERDGLAIKKQKPTKFAKQQDPYNNQHFGTTFGKGQVLKK